MQEITGQPIQINKSIKGTSKPTKSFILKLNEDSYLPCFQLHFMILCLSFYTHSAIFSNNYSVILHATFLLQAPFFFLWLLKFYNLNLIWIFSEKKKNHKLKSMQSMAEQSSCFKLAKESMPALQEVKVQKGQSRKPLRKRARGYT